MVYFEIYFGYFVSAVGDLVGQERKCLQTPQTDKRRLPVQMHTDTRQTDVDAKTD
jgi:hypothetical protein